MSESQRQTSTVSLEDILRIKRAERPPPEFWAEFDRSLRAKQLAALVEKKPWWRRLGSLSLAKWSLPAGAAAAAAIAFTVYRHSPSASDVRPAVSSASAVVAAAMPIVAVSPEDISPVAAGASAEAAPVSQTFQQVAAMDSSQSEVPGQSAAPAAETSVSAVPSRDALHLASVTDQLTGIGVVTESPLASSPRFASVGLKGSGDSEIASAFNRTEAATRGDKTTNIEPLAQLQSPRDARRARLLAFTSSVDTHQPQYSNSSGVIRSRERIAANLNEEALSESIRRLGLKNGGVSIQF